MKHNSHTKIWISQFAAKDRPTANHLIDNLRFVSALEFRSGLLDLATRTLPSNEISALFIERQLQSKVGGAPIKMYSEVVIPRKPRARLRATGAARAAVLSPRNDEQEIGSEGIVANIATELSRQFPARFTVQPSAEVIRSKQVRHLVVVTDFIGSGRRAERMLSSLWDVASVRSWHSTSLVRFHVLAFSGTKAGLKLAKGHRTRPTVSIVCACPTIYGRYKLGTRTPLLELCEQYGGWSQTPTGYGSSGALIAFTHGCPNNSPAILRESVSGKNKVWAPLFAEGTATAIEVELSRLGIDVVDIALETLRFPAVATSPAFQASTPLQKRVIVILAGVRRNHRNLPNLVLATALSTDQVVESIESAAQQGLLDIASMRLTSLGFGLLSALSETSKGSADTSVSPEANKMYYPAALRAPK